MTRSARRSRTVGALCVGAALLLGCSERANSTPESQVAEVAIEAKEPAPAAQPQERPQEQPTSKTDEEPAKSGAAFDDPCTKICSHTATLECGPLDHCLRGCAEMRASEICGDELAGFLRCSATHPAEHWECDPMTGAAAIKDGYCDAEQGAVVACMQRAR